MKDESEITKMFNEAVHQRHELEKACKDSQFMSGVADALGWVLEEYEEAPVDLPKPKRRKVGVR